MLHYYDLYEFNDQLSEGFPIDPFSLWYYLMGFYVSEGDNIVRATNGGYLTVTYQCKNCLKLCFNTPPEDENFCHLIEEAVNSLSQNQVQEYFDLLEQPRVHGDTSEDFVLIPFCSFGKDELKPCTGFHRSKVSYQDDTCFTYENPEKTGYKDAKFQFVLNSNMPKEEPLPLKVLLHEQGTIPDVHEIDSSSQEIYIENELTKIGISIESTEMTQSFEDMSFKKRQCYLNNEVKNYSRMDCLVKHVFKLAWDACHCTPWTLRQLVNETKGYCNTTGSICFRENTFKALESIGDQNCPKMCSYKQYKMMTPDHLRFDPFKYGDDYIDFLMIDPTNQLLENLFEKMPEKNGQTLEHYVKGNAKAFSMVQIYFHDPQMTVITKDAKVTMPDKVSNIGGTIGIFLGLSALSLMDLVIEYSKFIKRKCFKGT